MSTLGGEEQKPEGDEEGGEEEEGRREGWMDAQMRVGGTDMHTPSTTETPQGGTFDRREPPPLSNLFI